MLPRYSLSFKETDFFLKKQITIIGFESQGITRAEKLRDSGADVIIGNRLEKCFDKAAAAGYGSISRGKRIVSDETKEEMKKILEEVQSGKFANEWICEKRSGSTHHKAMVNEVRASDLKTAGKEFREIINTQP